MVKPGMHLRSLVCSTEIVVVRGSDDGLAIECGGIPMTSIDNTEAVDQTPDFRFMSGTQLGKRYADERHGLELLCTKAGDGSLTILGEPLVLKAAKPLPSSD